MLSATILEKLPLLPRLLGMLHRRKGMVALAIHTCTSKPGKPAELYYRRLVLITKVALLSF